MHRSRSSCSYNFSAESLESKKKATKTKMSSKELFQQWVDFLKKQFDSHTKREEVILKREESLREWESDLRKRERALSDSYAQQLTNRHYGGGGNNRSRNSSFRGYFAARNNNSNSANTRFDDRHNFREASSSFSGPGPFVPITPTHESREYDPLHPDPGSTMQQQHSRVYSSGAGADDDEYVPRSPPMSASSSSTSRLIPELPPVPTSPRYH
jgi:hypothetical protein